MYKRNRVILTQKQVENATHRFDENGYPLVTSGKYLVDLLETLWVRFIQVSLRPVVSPSIITLHSHS